MRIHFTKMHGLGNDFIVIDCTKEDCAFLSQEQRSNAALSFAVLARNLCHRRFGIGADQILLLSGSDVADFRMSIFNADGSQVEMCGNGIRCLAKYIWDRDLSDKDVLDIETPAGIIRPEKAGELVKVDMGEPVFEPAKIPVDVPLSEGRNGEVLDYPLRIGDREFRIACVSMGNPHAVIVVNEVSSFPVARYGPIIETHPVFPRKTNVEFIQILSEKEIRMRVWERGSGETMACGTGASAAAVAARKKGLTDNAVTIHLRGGALVIEWAADNHVYMTGPAATVFAGDFDPQEAVGWM